jgi:competence protein CoiA
VSEVAIHKLTSQRIYASDYNEAAWQELREASDKGYIAMECCGAHAVLKTSPNFLRFFAHFAGECSTAPETKWHLEVKSLIIKELTRSNIDCREEEVGKSKTNKKWKADTCFEYKKRKIVIEVQRSYQHLRRYIERQQIYTDSGIECYWLLHPKCFRALTSSIAKFRIKNEFSNSLPIGLFGNSPQLPMMWADFEGGLRVGGVALIEYSLELWIKSILDEKFKYGDFKWFIDGEPFPQRGKR